MAAICNAVWPSPLTVLISKPWLINTLTTSTCPKEHAQCKVESLVLEPSNISTGIPQSNSLVISFAFPLAICSKR